MHEPFRQSNGSERAQRIAVALACVWALLPIAAATKAAETPATHTVVIEDLKYTPETLEVKRGDVVVWVNKDPFPHTATAKGVFDSQSIATGQSWKFTASKAGEYRYLCTFHPNMKAVLKVE
jgi:plastocyanin